MKVKSYGTMYSSKLCVLLGLVITIAAHLTESVQGAVADIPLEVMAGLHQVLTSSRCVIAGGACFNTADGRLAYFPLGATEAECESYGATYKWEKTYNTPQELVEDAVLVENGIVVEDAGFKASYLMMIDPTIDIGQIETLTANWATQIGVELGDPIVCGAAATLIYAYMTLDEMEAASLIPNAFAAILPVPEKLKISPVFRELEETIALGGSNIESVRLTGTAPVGIPDGIDLEIITLVKEKTGVDITLSMNQETGKVETDQISVTDVLAVSDTMAIHHGLVLIEAVPKISASGGGDADPAVIIGAAVGGTFALFAGLFLVGHRRRQQSMEKMKALSADYIQEKDTMKKPAKRSDALFLDPQAVNRHQNSPPSELRSARSPPRQQQQHKRQKPQPRSTMNSEANGRQNARDRRDGKQKNRRQRTLVPSSISNTSDFDVVSVITEGGRRRKIEL